MSPFHPKCKDFTLQPYLGWLQAAPALLQKILQRHCLLERLCSLLSSFLTNARHYSLELRSPIWVAPLAPHYSGATVPGRRRRESSQTGLHLCSHLHCNRGAGAEPDRELSGRAGCIFPVTLQEALLMDPI